MDEYNSPAYATDSLQLIEMHFTDSRIAT